MDPALDGLAKRRRQLRRSERAPLSKGADCCLATPTGLRRRWSTSGFEVLPRAGEKLKVLSYREAVEWLERHLADFLGPNSRPWFPEHCHRVACLLLEGLGSAGRAPTSLSKLRPHWSYWAPPEVAVLPAAERVLKERATWPVPSRSATMSRPLLVVLALAATPFLEAPGAFLACSRLPRARAVRKRAAWRRLDSLLHDTLDLCSAQRRPLLARFWRACEGLDVEKPAGDFSAVASGFRDRCLSGAEAWGAGVDSQGRLVVFADTAGDCPASLRVAAASLDMVTGFSATVSGPLCYPQQPRQPRQPRQLRHPCAPECYVLLGALSRGTLWALVVDCGLPL